MISLKRVQLPSVVSLALLGAVALAVSGCSDEKKAETKEVVRPVKVVEIAEAGDTRALDYSGAVKARVEMNLGFRVDTFGTALLGAIVYSVISWLLSALLLARAR